MSLDLPLQEERDNERDDVFHRNADNVFWADETHLIADKPRLHEEHEASADDDPKVVDSVHVPTPNIKIANIIVRIGNGVAMIVVLNQLPRQL